ncbi:2TM domain-containing protein [Aequorivita viscosa]|uniref:2TM domain-containing protein n=1 Tax=Aequorivita viscosa TaxID=797419 RepID=A0A1M6A0E1_9FLAO|nr:2TM domain-containing protein [Aequorivita viscosa]SDW09043.1 2TM domain-containing protein [Aequorivita viscosa]SHI29935.1 2TM domain-containing protein [Aequorivita viscosa]
MFSKAKKSERIDAEQREQFEYARRRINQKKNLMRHFIAFLVGSILLIIINPVLGYGNETLFQDWFIWAILIWAFIFLVHLLNVFVMSSFMGKEWEDRQLEKLKARQTEKIAELQKKVDAEYPLNIPTPETPKNTLNNPLPPDVE